MECVLLGELIEILPNQILYILCCPQEMYLHSGGSSFKQELPFVDNTSSKYVFHAARASEDAYNICLSQQLVPIMQSPVHCFSITVPTCVSI